jgi:hypothetical protein
VDISLSKAAMYYGWNRPEPPPFAPFHDRELADRLVAICRRQVEEGKKWPSYSTDTLTRRTVDKLEVLTDEMEMTGVIR